MSFMERGNVERSKCSLQGVAGILASSLLFAGLSISKAEVIPLRNPTATLSQSGGWNVSVVTDGVTNDFAGWAVYDFNTGSASAQTAVFETETNAGFATGSSLTFSLYHVNHNPPALQAGSRLFLEPKYSPPRYRRTWWDSRRWPEWNRLPRSSKLARRSRTRIAD